MKRAMSAVMDLAAARMDDEYVLLGFQAQGDQFRIWTAIGNRTSVLQIEAAAHQLLQRVVEIQASRTDDCSACEACQSRAERARAAIAALAVGFTPDEPKSGPTSEAVH